MLLANLIAAGPNEMIPVVALKCHFGLLGCAIAIPNPTTVPIDSHQVNITNHAVVKSIDVVNIPLLVATLQSDGPP